MGISPDTRPTPAEPLSSRPGPSRPDSAEPGPQPAVPAPAGGLDQRQPAFDEFASNVMGEAVWKIGEYVTGAWHPGAGWAVKAGYRILRLAAGSTAVTAGEGFIFKIGVVETSLEGVNLAVGFRLAGIDSGELPDAKLRFDVSFIDPLALDAEEAGGPGPAGRWWQILEMAAVRQPALTLAGVRRLPPAESLAMLRRVDSGSRLLAVSFGLDRVAGTGRFAMRAADRLLQRPLEFRRPTG
jgi:hypothetical protein